MRHKFELDRETHELWLSPAPMGYHLRLQGGWNGLVALTEMTVGFGRLTMAGTSESVAFAVDGDVIHIHLRGRTRSLRYLDPLFVLAGAGGETGQNVERAPMPGVVVAVKVAPGDAVAAGAVLMVIESMKMEMQIRAPHDGVVERVHVKEGDSFDRDALLVKLLPGNS